MSENNNNDACPIEANEAKPKPCCVCKPEKEERDNCLLFNGQESGKCAEYIEKYKACMKGYGFETK